MWLNKLTLCIASFPLGDHSREAHTLESIQGLNFRLVIQTTKLFPQIYFRLKIKIDKKGRYTPIPRITLILFP